MTGDADRVTRCLEEHAAAWFGGEGRRTVADRTRLRQENMAIALSVSRWLELVESDEARRQMHRWLDEVEERAVRREAESRAEAFRRVRGWLDSCL